MSLFSRKNKPYIVTVETSKDIQVGAKNKREARAKAQQKGYRVKAVKEGFTK